MLEGVGVGGVLSNSDFLAQSLVGESLFICNLLHQTFDKEQCCVTTNAPAICTRIRLRIRVCFVPDLPQESTVCFD